MNLTEIDSKKAFLDTSVSKGTLIASTIVVILYTLFVIFLAPPGNLILFWLLVLSQLFFAFQSLCYVYTIWQTEYTPKFSKTFTPNVDVFITVCGEPEDVVKETLMAALEMDYPNFQVYILNDGLVAKKDNWKEIEKLTENIGGVCLTREIPGGAKAGNINNALANSFSPFIVVFDADHVPHKDFLKKTIGYFVDEKMGFVQSPQYYKNNDQNFITQAAWDQQALFFGPICKGKNRLNSTFMCGTNMVLRREAVLQAGGMCETNIAEDFLTSLFVHQKKWKSVYVPEVLAEGLSPEDFLSYYKQQFRWARGSLEVIFRFNPLFVKGLSLKQRIQYLASASYYLSGIFVLINISLPVIFFFTGIIPLQISGMNLVLLFLPYILLNLIILQTSSNFTYTFKALSFSFSSFYLQLKAIFAVIFNIKTPFAVTPKKQQEGNFLNLVIPHLIYIGLVVGGLVLAFEREGLSASVLNNLAWALLNITIFSQYIYAAMPRLKTK